MQNPFRLSFWFFSKTVNYTISRMESLSSRLIRHIQNLLNRSVLWFNWHKHWLLCHCSYTCICRDLGLWAMRANFHACHVQLTCMYRVSTLYIIHVTKCTRLSPSLAGSPGNRGGCWVNKRGLVYPRSQALPAKEGESLVHFIMCVTSG